MSRQKAVQIQIADIQYENYSESITDLGCYYSLLKEKSQCVDVRPLADLGGNVIVPIRDEQQSITITLKSLTDQTLVGSIMISCDGLLQQAETEFIEWFDFSKDGDVQMRLKIKFTVISQEFQSASPLKSSSLNNSDCSSDSTPKVSCHYMTMGQELDPLAISLFTPASPTFRKMADASVQVGGNADYRQEYEQMTQRYQQSQLALQHLQKECSEVLGNNRNSDKQLRVMEEEIQKLRTQLQSQQREYILLQDKKSSGLDDALLEQIRKLKGSLRQMEESNKAANQQIELFREKNEKLTQQVDSLVGQLEKQKSQFEMFSEKQQRSESILSLTDEQNKYILQLNQKLVENEKELLRQIHDLTHQRDLFLSSFRSKDSEVERLKTQLQKQECYHSILNNINNTKLNSYEMFFGSLNNITE